MIGRPIEPEHCAFLHDLFLGTNKRSWCCFAPFLCAYSLEPNRVVCVDEIAGSVCLTVQRPDRVDLLMPPVPCDADIVSRVIEKLADAQGGRCPRILWVDEQDAEHLTQFDLRDKDAEYIYSPERIVAAEGRAYRDVRKRVRRFERNYKSIFRTLTPADVPACKDLLKHWRKRQGRRHPFLFDWGYTLAALDQFAYWSEEVLRGWCVEVEGQVDAFALTGEMRPDMAHFFVAKADPDLADLSYFLRWCVFEALSEYRWVNDAGDLGLSGMRQFKQKFRPVDQWPVFSAEPR